MRLMETKATAGIPVTELRNVFFSDKYLCELPVKIVETRKFTDIFYKCLAGKIYNYCNFSNDILDSPGFGPGLSGEKILW